MFQRVARAMIPLLALSLLVSAGCGRKPPPEASPEQARETFKKFLEAWKSGKSKDAIQASESIQVSDSDLEQGMKLVSYEVQGDGSRELLDWQMRAKLTLEDSKGAKSEKRATYSVGTSPNVVVRKEM